MLGRKPFGAGGILQNPFTIVTIWSYPQVSISTSLCFENSCHPKHTLPETNIFAPENGWLEYNFPIGMAYFQVRTVSFREGKLEPTYTMSEM